MYTILECIPYWILELCPLCWNVYHIGMYTILDFRIVSTMLGVYHSGMYTILDFRIVSAMFASL